MNSIQNPDNKTSKNTIHAAHTFYKCNNQKFTNVELLILISSALFFRHFNPNATLDFYGDKKTATDIKNLLKDLNLYDNIDTELNDKYVKNKNINSCKSYSFSKFVALNDLAKKYNDSICVIDTDLISFNNIQDLLTNNTICITHFELSDDKTIYPEIENVNKPKNYSCPKDCLNFKGYACNTSIIAIYDKQVVHEYTTEFFDFISNNHDITLSDLLWIEQLMLSIIANKHHLNICTLVDSIYNPTKFKFIPKKWKFYNIYSLINKKNFSTYHTWMRKNLLSNNKLFSKYTCLALLQIIKKNISPEKVEDILDLKPFKSLKQSYEKYSYKSVFLIYTILYYLAIIKDFFKIKILK